MEPLTILAAVAVAVLGVGRLARLILWDSFPPAVWVRLRWDRWTHKSTWNMLLHCVWCLSPWLMLVSIGWFLAGLQVLWLAWAWWLFWGWLALSYLVAMVYVRDEPPHVDA